MIWIYISAAVAVLAIVGLLVALRVYDRRTERALRNARLYFGRREVEREQGEES